MAKAFTKVTTKFNPHTGEFRIVPPAEIEAMERELDMTGGRSDISLGERHNSDLYKKGLNSPFYKDRVDYDDYLKNKIKSREARKALDEFIPGMPGKDLDLDDRDTAARMKYYRGEISEPDYYKQKLMRLTTMFGGR